MSGGLIDRYLKACLVRARNDGNVTLVRMVMVVLMVMMMVI